MLDLRLDKAVHFVLPALVKEPGALSFIWCFIHVNGLLDPFVALLFHIHVMLEKVSDREFLEVLNFGRLTDNLLC